MSPVETVSVVVVLVLPAAAVRRLLVAALASTHRARMNAGTAIGTTTATAVVTVTALAALITGTLSMVTMVLEIPSNLDF